jgi:hypothetical protein
MLEIVGIHGTTATREINILGTAAISAIAETTREARKLRAKTGYRSTAD